MSKFIEGKHLGPFALLPAPADACQECAVKHEPAQPHNQQSLFWQYKFYNEHGRWPTWADAMAHCTPEIQAFWKKELLVHGIDVDKEKSTGAQPEASALGEDEALIDQSLEIFVTEQKASVSLLQRRLRLGYSRAARIVDELERLGYIGPARGAEPREVFGKAVAK